MYVRLICSLTFSTILASIIAFSQSSLLNSFRNDIAEADAISDDFSLLAHKLEVLGESPNFGFGNMVADYAFLQFLQYFGNDIARDETGYKLSSVFLQPVLKHDPYYKDYYLFVSGSVTIYAGEPEKSVALMEAGLNALGDRRPPNIYYAWRYKAADELLFLGDSEAAQHSFEMAAELAMQSSDPDSLMMADLSSQTAQFLSTNPNSKQAQISAWSSILTSALDNETRNKAVDKIRELGGEVVFGENGAIKIEYAQVNSDMSRENSGS